MTSKIRNLKLVWPNCWLRFGAVSQSYGPCGFSCLFPSYFAVSARYQSTISTEVDSSVDLNGDSVHIHPFHRTTLSAQSFLWTTELDSALSPSSEAGLDSADEQDLNGGLGTGRDCEASGTY
jgi:hypothetical protein